jgi:DNA-binding response OmpR family regulator
MARVLIVEDESSIALAIRDELIFEGYEVETASDGVSALRKARQFRPEVLLLDVELPGMNGYDVCKSLRPDMPDMWIIMLTVRCGEADRVTGFERGADDYVTKPFSLRELMARIKVGLRRKRSGAAQAIQRCGEIEIDPASHRVTKRGAEVMLTRKEFEMLRMLIARAGDVITRDEFLDEVWGEEVYVTPRVIDTHIAALRKKIEDDPNNPKYILGVRGLGYKLDRNLTES